MTNPLEFERRDRPDFLKINGSAIAIDRLVAVRHCPLRDEGIIYSPEHYQAVFDTGLELRLTPNEGVELVHRLNEARNPSEGKTATTSSSAM
jgi:hypothetical protein